MKIHKNYSKKHIAYIFSKAFMEDDAYITRFPEEERRESVLYHFFRAYLRILEGSCHLWSENGCYALIYDPEKKVSTFRSYFLYYTGFIMGIGVAKTEGFKGFSKFLNDILNGSDWLDELENYIHLDLLVVSPEQKGKGLGKAMMHHIFSEAKDRGKMITLETQTQENMEMYKHFGFKIHKVINHNSYTEYYMINNKYTKN